MATYADAHHTPQHARQKEITLNLSPSPSASASLSLPLSLSLSLSLFRPIPFSRVLNLDLYSPVILLPLQRYKMPPFCFIPIYIRRAAQEHPHIYPTRRSGTSPVLGAQNPPLRPAGGRGGRKKQKQSTAGIRWWSPIQLLNRPAHGLKYGWATGKPCIPCAVVDLPATEGGFVVYQSEIRLRDRTRWPC